MDLGLRAARRPAPRPLRSERGGADGSGGDAVLGGGRAHHARAPAAPAVRRLPGYARIIEKHHAVVRPLSIRCLDRGAITVGPVRRRRHRAADRLREVANLFMVRAEELQRDLAVRRAIGATGPVTRLQMAEACSPRAGARWSPSCVGLPALIHAAPPGIPRLDEVAVSGTSSSFFLLAALLSAVLRCGAPRAASPDLMRLREGGRGATRAHHGRGMVWSFSRPRWLWCF